jgi:hypothetical protein
VGVLERSEWRARAALGIAALMVVIGTACFPADERQAVQLRARPRLGRNKALDVLGHLRPGLKREELAKLDFDKSIGFFQGWEARAAVLCIKDDELRFPDERAPVFLFISAIDLTDFDGAFGGLRQGIYVAVGSGSDDAIALYRFTQRKTPLKKVTTTKRDMPRESPQPRYMVTQQRGGGAFTLYMMVGKQRYEWVLLEPKPAQAEKKP